MKRKLVMHIPPELAAVIDRRRNGKFYQPSEIFPAYIRIQVLYQKYLRTKTKLDHLLDVEWEEKKIESYFRQGKWYAAHRRLRNLEAILKETHKKMFYLLLHADGNYEELGFDSLSAPEIWDDFDQKYGYCMKKPQ